MTYCFLCCWTSKHQQLLILILTLWARLQTQPLMLTDTSVIAEAGDVLQDDATYPLTHSQKILTVFRRAFRRVSHQTQSTLGSASPVERATVSQCLSASSHTQADVMSTDVHAQIHLSFTTLGMHIGMVHAQV